MCFRRRLNLAKQESQLTFLSTCPSGKWYQINVNLPETNRKMNFEVAWFWKKMSKMRFGKKWVKCVLKQK